MRALTILVVCRASCQYIASLTQWEAGHKPFNNKNIHIVGDNSSDLPLECKTITAVLVTFPWPCDLEKMGFSSKVKDKLLYFARSLRKDCHILYFFDFWGNDTLLEYTAQRAILGKLIGYKFWRRIKAKTGSRAVFLSTVLLLGSHNEMYWGFVATSWIYQIVPLVPEFRSILLDILRCFPCFTHPAIVVWGHSSGRLPSESLFAAPSGRLPTPEGVGLVLSPLAVGQQLGWAARLASAPSAQWQPPRL